MMGVCDIWNISERSLAGYYILPEDHLLELPVRLINARDRFASVYFFFMLSIGLEMLARKVILSALL